MSNWKTFFDHHAPQYMQNVFTQNTLFEVDFLIEEMRLPPRSSILDMGCGTGRHSIELTKRGYRMTGVDLSEGMLEEARKAALAAGVNIEWIESDATQFEAKHHFDGAICLCEGAFGLVNLADESENHDVAILNNIYHALKPGAPFVLTALNGLRAIRQYNQEDVDMGVFDPMTLIETYPMEYETPEGKKTLLVREKKYLPHELASLCRRIGFEILHVWGGTAGSWHRKPVQLDEMEVMISARKPDKP
jgi:SAM-dependent methyltransferase